MIGSRVALLVTAVIAGFGHVSNAQARVTLVPPGEDMLQNEIYGLSAETTSVRRCVLSTYSPGRRQWRYRIEFTGPMNLIRFNVNLHAAPGTWTIQLRCAAERDSTAVKLRGKSGRRTAPLIGNGTLQNWATDYPDLFGANRAAPLIPPQLDPTDGKELGGPDPRFEMPFPCGERWIASTYVGHGSAVDWNSPSGSDAGRPVAASFDGIAYTGARNRRNLGFGNYIVISHGNSWTTLYAHLKTYRVANGQQVRRGQIIGTVGSSGTDAGPHLHYEQRFKNAAQPVRIEYRSIGRGLLTSTNCAPEPLPVPTTSSPVSPFPDPPIANVTLRVDNRVTDGAAMREDSVPAYLSTRPWTRCKSRGCAINGYDRWSGETYSPATCQTQGERTSNGSESNPSDDANPELYSSTRFYGIALPDNALGFISEVWVDRAQRGGLGLPAC